MTRDRALGFVIYWVSTDFSPQIVQKDRFMADPRRLSAASCLAPGRTVSCTLAPKRNANISNVITVVKGPQRDGMFPRPADAQL